MSGATFLYLHGFASSPGSRKATLLRQRMRRWGLELRAPDLNVPTFSSVTLTAMIERVEAEIDACPPGPVHVIASSFGAAAALQLPGRGPVASRLGRIMLLAPSLDFIGNRLRELGAEGMAAWRRSGTYAFFHHPSERLVPVHYALIEDLERHGGTDLRSGVPILILHGYHDEVVPYEDSVRFVAAHPDVILRGLNTDHKMLDALDTIWAATVEFFELCRSGDAANVSIARYRLDLPAEAAEFARHQDELFTVLSRAYGSRSLTREQFARRLHSISHTVFLAFSTEYRERRILGGSFIRGDGKRGATGVLPEHQCRGVGRALVCASFDSFATQFTEVESPNEAMVGLLSSCGFTAIADECALRSRLGRTWDLVQSSRIAEGRLVYRRVSHHKPGAAREFVALVRDPLVAA